MGYGLHLSVSACSSIIVSLALDHTSLFGLPVKKIHSLRVLGMCLVLSGTVASQGYSQVPTGLSPQTVLIYIFGSILCGLSMTLFSVIGHSLLPYVFTSVRSSFIMTTTGTIFLLLIGSISVFVKGWHWTGTASWWTLSLSGPLLVLITLLSSNLVSPLGTLAFNSSLILGMVVSATLFDISKLFDFGQDVPNATWVIAISLSFSGLGLILHSHKYASKSEFKAQREFSDDDSLTVLSSQDRDQSFDGLPWERNELFNYPQPNDENELINGDETPPPDLPSPYGTEKRGSAKGVLKAPRVHQDAPPLPPAPYSFNANEGVFNVSGPEYGNMAPTARNKYERAMLDRAIHDLEKDLSLRHNLFADGQSRMVIGLERRKERVRQQMKEMNSSDPPSRPTSMEQTTTTDGTGVGERERQKQKKTKTSRKKEEREIIVRIDVPEQAHTTSDDPVPPPNPPPWPHNLESSQSASISAALESSAASLSLSQTNIIDDAYVPNPPSIINGRTVNEVLVSLQDIHGESKRVGLVYIDLEEDPTLSIIRQKILLGVQSKYVKKDFIFLRGNTPIGTRQEGKKQLSFILKNHQIYISAGKKYAWEANS